MSLAGLSQINLELSSRCDKACFFCGHQNPKVNVHLDHGDMEPALIEDLAAAIPTGVVVQFHRDGEPLVYPWLREALLLFGGHVTSLVTNGNQLGDRADEILASPPTSICVSMFKGDPDEAQQCKALRRFIDVAAAKGRLPLIVAKIVGEDLEPERMQCWEAYEQAGLVRITRRALHAPQGSHHYRRTTPTIPETGICADLLHHPSIDWKGGMFLCQRLDPEQRHFLGRIPPFTLEELWNGERRMGFVRAHLEGRRGSVAPCDRCEYWGHPAS